MPARTALSRLPSALGRALLPAPQACPRLVPALDVSLVDEEGILQQLRQAHTVALGKRPHPGGEVAPDRHGQEVGVRTRARTARHVPLCGAFDPGLRLCLGFLRFAPLSARLCASLRRLSALLPLLGQAAWKSLEDASYLFPPS